MDHNIGKEDVSLDFLEKTLRDFYRKEESCRGWETNVVTQPKAVNNIVNVGATRIAAGMGVGDELKDKNVAGMIDHTLLKPDATPEEIKAQLKYLETGESYKPEKKNPNEVFNPLLID